MAEKAIEVYEFDSAATGERMLGLWPRVNHPRIAPLLWRLGFKPREVSGRKDRGGDGQRQHRIWVLWLKRYTASPLLQAEVKLLLAEFNPGPPGDTLNTRAVLHWRGEVAKLKGQGQKG